jgi:hypothetical protein
MVAGATIDKLRLAMTAVDVKLIFFRVIRPSIPTTQQKYHGEKTPDPIFARVRPA